MELSLETATKLSGVVADLQTLGVNCEIMQFIIEQVGMKEQIYSYARRSMIVTSDDVIRAITEEYQVDAEFVTSKSRDRRFIDSRAALCYILYTYLSWTLKEIGTLLGGKDHTTVMHNRECFRRLYYCDEAYKERADRVLDKLMLSTKKFS